MGSASSGCEVGSAAHAGLLEFIVNATTAITADMDEDRRRLIELKARRGPNNGEKTEKWWFIDIPEVMKQSISRG